MEGGMPVSSIDSGTGGVTLCAVVVSGAAVGSMVPIGSMTALTLGSSGERIVGNFALSQYIGSPTLRLHGCHNFGTRRAVRTAPLARSFPSDPNPIVYRRYP